MKINMDFGKLIIVTPAESNWVTSPNGEVQRLMLERDGLESGYATSIVRYPSGGSFPYHTHTGGEEYLVLEGVFSDETGDHHPRTYVRNPIGSGHAPFSKEGCLIFVKLCQMLPSELSTMKFQIPQNFEEKITLSSESGEEVFVQRLREYEEQCFSGVEILLIEGIIELDGRELRAHTWIRVPKNSKVYIKVREVSLIWVKMRNFALRH